MSTPDLLGHLFNKKPDAAEPEATPAPTNESNIPDLLHNLFPATPTAAQESSTQTSPASTNPSSVPDLLSGVVGLNKPSPDDKLSLTSEDRDYADNASPDKMEDEPWYSKAWNWMNSPFYDLHKWGTREGAGTFERGLETGLETLGDNIFTPLQFGLTIATFGGGAVEEAGIAALRSIGVAEKLAPTVVKSAKFLMDAGFASQMVGGLMTQVPQFLDALKDGDVENATRLGTETLGSGAFLTLGLKHGYEDLDALKTRVKGGTIKYKDMTTTERLAKVKEISGLFDQAVQMGSDDARAKADAIGEKLKAAGIENDDIRQAGIRHFVRNGGDITKIAKELGISEGTIRPRELTAEEKVQEDKNAELRAWAEASDKFTKNADGSPREFFAAKSAEGTDKLGQTLTQTGKEEDAHYVQVKNPYIASTKESLDRFIEQQGGQEETKKILQDAGHDGIVYNTADPQVIAFDKAQTRPVPEFTATREAAWSREHAYVAVDRKDLEKIKNQGINPGIYHASPEQALENAKLPDSGNKSDLVVLSVPRDEVEQAAREANAAVHAQTNRGVEGPVEVLPRKEPFDYEERAAIPENLRGANSSEDSVYHHEVAHIAEAELNDIPTKGVQSPEHLEANGKYLASAVVDIGKFRTKGQWDPEKIKNPAGLLNAVMAGVASDEYLHGRGRWNNNDSSNDFKMAREILSAVGVKDKTQQDYHINKAVDRVIEHLKNPVIENIITEESSKREKGLNKSLLFSEARTKHIGDLIKRALNGEQIPEAEKAGNKPRPPVNDEDLVTDKRLMPGHQLEMEVGKNDKGEQTIRATGRTIPLRPLGAEELPGNTARFNNAYTPAEAERYRAGLRAGMNLTPAEIEIAQDLRQIYDNSFQKAYERGQIRSWIESYHPQAWASHKNSMWHRIFNNDTEDVTSGALNQLRHDTDSGKFDTNANAARHRAYNTEFQGVMAGEKFKTSDLRTHLYNHLNGFAQADAAREFVNNIRKADVRGSDGRPLVVLKGTARKFGGDENPALAINPERTQKIHIDPEKVLKMMDPDPQTGINELQKGLRDGTIEKLPFTIKNDKGQNMAAYAYTADGYESIDHHSMRAWGYAGQDTAGNPALMESEMHVHPDVASYVRQLVGADESPVRSNKILSGINTAAGEAKGMLLSFSPFHIVQEALRGALVGINPLKYDHININDSPDLQRGVRNGLVRSNYKAADQFSTGFASHSKLISKVPGLNRVQSAMQSFLFDKYIPGLKDRAYIKLYHDILTENPKLTFDQAADRAADMTNDTFGGQNWRKMGVTTAQQDFMRMTLLAPDWLVSELKMLKRVTGGADPETVAISRRQMAIQVASIWAVARVLNMLSTGEMHNEAPFGVAHKDKDGKEVVYSVRTLPTDIIHAVSDPEGFLRGRVNPLTVRPTIEFLSGRDELGRRASGLTQVKHLFKNVAPIVGQGVFGGNSLNPLEQVAKGVGGNVARYRTEAEKLADQYASDRMPSGPVEPENLAAHQKELNLEDAVRQGSISPGQLKHMIAPRRAEELMKRINLTPLQARFDRLPLSEALNVWASATPTEKSQLSKQLWKKRYDWLNEHPADERAGEPVWRKLQDTYADLR